jgi:hypothetical protein
MWLPSSWVCVPSCLPFPPREQLLAAVVRAVLVVAVVSVVSPLPLPRCLVPSWPAGVVPIPVPIPIPVALRRRLLAPAIHPASSGWVVPRRWAYLAGSSLSSSACSSRSPLSCGGCWVIPVVLSSPCPSCVVAVRRCCPRCSPCPPHEQLLVAAVGGAVVVVVVPSLRRLPLAPSFSSQLLSIPPREQLLTTAVGEAGVVVHRRPFFGVVPLIHGLFHPASSRSRRLGMRGWWCLVVLVVLLSLSFPSSTARFHPASRCSRRLLGLLWWWWPWSSSPRRRSPSCPCRRPSLFSFSFPRSRFPFSVSRRPSSCLSWWVAWAWLGVHCNRMIIT